MEPRIIPRFTWPNEEAMMAIRDGKPVVLEGSPLLTPAVGKWTWEYLEQQLPSHFSCFVFEKQSVDSAPGDPVRFQYWDPEKNSGGYRFEQPTMRHDMSFRAFAEKARTSSSTSRWYLQQELVDGVGENLKRDFSDFDITLAMAFKMLGGWGALSSNLLLAGQAGHVTPCHFDEQQNLFGQVVGRKVVRLWSPLCFGYMRPAPLYHPLDRQATVDVDDPECAELRRYEYRATLGPGDVLYLPQYWWHQIEALDENVSVNWWFKDQDTSRAIASLAKAQTQSGAEAGDEGEHRSGLCVPGKVLVATLRNMERLITAQLGGGREANRFFVAVANGEVAVESGESGECGEDVTSEQRERWAATIKKARTALSLILLPSQITPFLLELATDRQSLAHGNVPHSSAVKRSDVSVCVQEAGHHASRDWRLSRELAFH